MASVVLNQRSLTDQLSANGASIGGGGITSVGPVTANGITSLGPVTANGITSLGPVTANGIITAYNDIVGTGVGGDYFYFDSQTGNLTAYGTITGGTIVAVGNITAGGTITTSSLGQANTATIPLGSATIAVALPAITANSLVLVTGRGAPDATAISFNVVLNAGVGFSITANANTTAAKTVTWFVVRF